MTKEAYAICKLQWLEEVALASKQHAQNLRDSITSLERQFDDTFGVEMRLANAAVADAEHVLSVWRRQMDLVERMRRQRLGSTPRLPASRNRT